MPEPELCECRLQSRRFSGNPIPRYRDGTRRSRTTYVHAYYEARAAQRTSQPARRPQKPATVTPIKQLARSAAAFGRTLQGWAPRRLASSSACKVAAKSSSRAIASCVALSRFDEKTQKEHGDCREYGGPTAAATHRFPRLPQPARLRAAPSILHRVPTLRMPARVFDLQPTQFQQMTSRGMSAKALLTGDSED